MVNQPPGGNEALTACLTLGFNRPTHVSDRKHDWVYERLKLDQPCCAVACARQARDCNICLDCLSFSCLAGHALIRGSALLPGSCVHNCSCMRVHAVPRRARGQVRSTCRCGSDLCRPMQTHTCLCAKMEGVVGSTVQLCKRKCASMKVP